MNNFSNFVSMKTLKISVSILFVIILISFGLGCERIDTGNVGIKVNMTGGSQGVSNIEYVTGYQFYFKPMQRIYEFPVYQQRATYDPFEIPSKGGTVFEVHPNFNFSLNSGEVANMFQNLRLPIEQLVNGYIKNATFSACREVTNSFTPDSLLNNLSSYDAAILSKLNEKLAPFFTVSQFTAGLIPDEGLKKAILAKSQAVQDAQAAISQIAVAEAQAKIDLTNARKDSAVLVIKAQSEAKSIALKQESLKNSPQYIELIKAEKWDGKLPTVTSGESGMILQMKQ
jgi:hypothetical protein